MKNKILSFALPLLLAASPAAATEARLLWVNVEASATVVDGAGNESSAAQFEWNGKEINAFRASVPDGNAPDGSACLGVVYENGAGEMVVGDPDVDTSAADLAAGSAEWAPFDLAAYADRDLVVTLELGHADWGSGGSFERLAVATETLGNLLDAPHVSIQSDLNPPALTPWAPDRFTVTAVWTISYDLAGGTNNPANPAFYLPETALPIPLLPAGRDGYTFAGWTNELGAAVDEIGAGSTGDRSFGATWLENIEPPALGSKIYNGALQTADVPANAGYTVVSNAGGTNAGTYDVVLALASGYAWSDGTTADKTVTWSITPAVATVFTVAGNGATTNAVGYYATIADAVAAATNGCTVLLLGDATLDARVEPNAGADTAITIDLGGHKITRTGTSGNGSVFDVKSGDVTIKNGTIDCTQDDTAIVADGVYAITSRSGSTVTLADLGVTVDSQAGACVYPFAGSHATIVSGNYANNTTKPYQYHEGWKGMAVNQANVDEKLLTITGGTFSQMDPQIGDDSRTGTDAASADFTGEGYVSILENGKYVVQPGWNVTFDANGGDPTPAAQRIKAGDPATEPAAPTKDHYSFRAWQTNGVDWVFADAVPTNLTLVADWTIDTFTVTWVVTGATVRTDAGVPYGSTTNFVGETPAKDADAQFTYTFAGWTTNGVDVTPASVGIVADTTFTARFSETLNKYTVTFSWHDGSLSEDYDYGTAAGDVAVPRDPPSYVENGTIYTFARWSAEVPETITDDVTITAEYSSVAAAATVFTVADCGATTNSVGYYATIADAVSAATNGCTVLLLGDATLDARVEPDAGADAAITIDLGGHKITRAGTSGNGSVFDVKSGDVTIKNGTIDCTQDDTAIVADGVYAITSRSGSTVTLADLDVAVDSQAGACVYPFAGSHVTIESGNYANTTDKPYQYHTGWQGMAVNQANVDDKLLTITGGTFSQQDPQLGDDSRTGTDAASADFTGEGYVAIDENGKFVVQPGWNVTFDANGGDPTPAAQRVAAGGTATRPADPTLANHWLRAWQTNGVDWVFTDVVPSDITLVADWELNQFDVIWMSNGAEYASNHVAYGTAMPFPEANPVKASTDSVAYTFAGWTPAPDETVTSNATYTAVFDETSLANAIWIGGDAGDWAVPGNWDIGFVPTSATVVTFTNDAEVAIGQDRCKEMVLSNAYVTVAPAAGASEPTLHFAGNEERAVSVPSGATGTLAVDDICLFNDDISLFRVNSGFLTIGSDFEILNDVTFRGMPDPQYPGFAGKFYINGKATISGKRAEGAVVCVRPIENSMARFSNGIEVSKGVTAKLRNLTTGAAWAYKSKVTLVATDNATDTPVTAVWMRGEPSPIIDEAHTNTCYVKTREGAGSFENVSYDIFEARWKPTVKTVTGTGATVTGVAEGQYVTPGEKLAIGATDLAEGCEAILVITKHSDGSELVKTKTLPCEYTMKDFDIDVSVTAVLKTFDVVWLGEDGETRLDATNGVPYGTAYASLSAPNPAKAGDDGELYTFAGWTPEPDATVTSNATYTASFKTWTKIAVPTAETKLVYDGTGQTGVVAGEGYALSGNVATNAGGYAATVALADPENTVWADATEVDAAATADRTIEWSIAKRAITIAAADASKIAGNPDPEFSASIASGSLAEGQEIAYSFVVTDGADASTKVVTPSATITVAATGADATANYDVTAVPGALTIGEAKVSVFTVADNGATTNTVGYYATIADAVAAATNGCTVLLLDDATLAERVEPNPGADTAITIDLGGHKITRTGTSGNGSAFDVKSGDVTIRNGTIDCTQDDTAIVADGVYAITSRSGSNVTLADLDVTVNSQAGACVYPFAGSHITIESGNYANTTDRPYQYHDGWQGMAVNQANVADKLLTITGGTFSQVDPQLGDDSTTGTDVASADFTADGYVAILENGKYVVQPGWNVTFNANGGDPTPAAQRVAAGGTATRPADPTLANHWLRAWQTNGVDWVFTDVVPSDITLVADWELNQFDVIWMSNGAEYASNHVAYGTAMPFPEANPVKASTDSVAYTFAGWTPAPDETVTSNATYTAVFDETSLANAVWIGGAQGDWNVPGNWDIGYVPTTATIVTFTNDAQVGIASAWCKETVLVDADVTIVPASGASGPLLHFSGNEGRAVSGSGMLGVDYIGLFNDNKTGYLTICGLDVLNDVSLRGNQTNGVAASFEVVGKTTISANALVKTFDNATTKFQGGIEVAKGVTAKIKTNPNGGAQIGTGVTLVANDGTGNDTAIWLMKNEGNSRGASLVDGAKIAVDAAHDGTYYVKNSGTGALEGVYCDIYEATPKRTVVNVAATGATVTGVTAGQRVVPGENLTIGVTGLAEGYEAVLVITKHSDGSELLNTKELPCVYSMPDYDVDVTITAVLKNFTVVWVAENDQTSTNVTYGTETASIRPADPTKAGDDGALYTFAGWTPEPDATVTSNATYVAAFKTWTKVAVPAAATSLVYDGTAQTGVAAGEGYELSGNVATNAGGYTATVALADPENTVWADATEVDAAATADRTIEWSIAKRAITIAAADASKIAGNPDPEFSASIASGSLAEGQEIAYSFVVTDGADASTKVVTPSATITVAATGADATANYDVTAVPGALTIGEAKVSVFTVADNGATTNTVGYYATIADAVAAATNGCTVLLLDDATLAERVEPNPGADTAITIDLGGHKITRTGTSGNGSAFDVKSGDVTIRNGTIDCTQDDTAIVADGVYAITSRSGSNVTLADLDVTVNSQAGACVYPFAGSHVTIESGNYANTTDKPYQYHTGWQGMAVNQANVDDKLLTITGGTFSQQDPQLGDDSRTGTDAASADFTADGYVAILKNGKYVVQPGWNVTFDANGGDPTPAAQRVKAGDPAAAPTGVTKANHRLRAWQTNGVDWVFTDVVPTNLTLVADWEIDSFDVIWIADGSQYASNHVDYGEATPVPATNPTKAGDENALYTFANWTPEPEETVTNNATYTAVFKTWTKIAVPTAATNLVYNGQGQTGVAAGDGYTVSGNVATNAGTYAATVALADPENTVWADDDVAPSTNATRTVTFTIAAVYVAQVGDEKFFTIAEAITAAGGLDAAAPEVITLLADADASVTLTATSQRLRVALENHKLTVLPGDPVRYEVAKTPDADVADVTVFALEQLKADGLMIVRFDYAAAKLAYDMGSAENMLKMYPTNEPIWCTVATATDLAATSWTAVESSRAWKENLVPPASATDADLEWLENLDTTSSPVRFWRIAVTPFALSPNEEIGFKPAKQSGE